MRRAADELGVDFDEHLQRVIDAMEARKEELGLEPREGAAA
jgi:predicted hydrolase (HD superfamily)